MLLRAELRLYLEPIAVLAVRSFGEIHGNQGGFAGKLTPLATGSRAVVAGYERSLFLTLRLARTACGQQPDPHRRQERWGRGRHKR